MLTHRVVDPVVQQTPLDALGIVVFALAFASIAYASVRKPSLGVALLLASVPFDFSHDVGHTTITLAKIALLANAVGLLLGRRDLRIFGRPAERTLLLCALGIVAATALSIVPATYRGAALRETLKALEYACAFAVVVVAFSADPDERPIQLFATWVAFAVSLLAIAEEFTGAPSGLWFHNVAIPRIAGPLEGPNQLAAYLGLMLALVVATTARKSRAPFEITTLALGGTALALTISRSGIVASLIGIALVFASSRGPSRRPAAIAILGGAALGVAFVGLIGFLETHTFGGIGVLDRYATLAEAESPGAVGTRSQLWHAAYVLWRTHPLFGIGAGNFERELGLAGYPRLHTHANSLYVQALVEGGIPLALATLALVYSSIARFARGPFADPIVLATFAASVGLASHQIFDLLLFYPKVGEQWWILLGLAAVRVDRSAVRS